MGGQISTKCLDCGREFTFDDGGGFVFHLLRCDTCGETKGVGFEELGELHLRYLKGLSVPYCEATRDHDERVRADPTLKPISERTYHNRVEVFAGACSCGGKFRFNARPRCPGCRSTRIGKCHVTALYD